MQFQESFTDQIQRLFPLDSPSSLQINGNFCRSITIQVTEDCNLRCSYCYQHDKTPFKLDINTGKKFIDLILASDERSNKYIQSTECAGVVLDFIGGEPFLEIDTIDILTDYFINKMIELNHPWLNRFRISIGSNGLLYFTDKVQKYIKKNANHLSLTITVDGNKKLHDMCRLDADGNGSYDRAVAAAQDYTKRYGIAIGTKATLSPQNVQYTAEALIDFISNNEKIININCVYEKGWEIEHARILYQQLKQVANYVLEHNLQDDCYISILDWIAGTKHTHDGPWCGGSGLMIALDVHGDIYPCIRYTPSSVGQNHEKFKIGDVDHGFIYNEEQEERLKCMACITRRSQDEKTEHCLDCPISMGCGDCAAYSYEVFGEVGHRTTYICDMHKARCLAQVYYRHKAWQKTGKKELIGLNCPKEWAIPIIGEEEYHMLEELVQETEKMKQGK